ncbi:hypothetical protein AQUCO_06300041v1 [Aquilegia coerulea]|uniref:Uncharacterized protein n=1 Tax=Aquilegia coerulea TaxID=218851 RepID=A0A2G5CCS3_AQUCA|nr:hypothetical protein AQUCO_06300041v1 [Aquilegia coerulea]
MDAIDCARKGDVEFFKTVASDVLLNSMDGDGESVLSVAVKHSHLDCCKEILKNCPSLLYHQSSYQHTALHHATWDGKPEIVKFLISATWDGKPEIVKFLISACAQTDFGNREQMRKKKLLMMVNVYGLTALHNTVSNSDIDKGNRLETIKLLIEAVPDNEMLRMVDKEKQSVLHKAVLLNDLEVVKLLIEAGPDIEYSANNSGEIPLFTAEAQSHENRHDSGKIRKELLQWQPSQSKVHGENGWTALHYAAYKGDVSAVEDIMQVCPKCAELVDNVGQNFLHLAAKHQHIEVVKHVLGNIATSILNAKNNYGNTPLHIAAISENQSMTLCFLYDPKVDNTTTNSNGQKVLDAVSQYISKF